MDVERPGKRPLRQEVERNMTSRRGMKISLSLTCLMAWTAFGADTRWEL